jgi:dienelactone hydrolase
MRRSRAAGRIANLILVCTLAGSCMTIQADVPRLVTYGLEAHYEAPRNTQTVMSSTVGACMDSTAAERTTQVWLYWSGEPSSAKLTLATRGVRADVDPRIYVNGQDIGQAASDVLSYQPCAVAGGSQNEYPFDPQILRSGWNEISISPETGWWRRWTAQDGVIVIEGDLTGPDAKEFAFVSSYDEEWRYAAYQSPIGYNPAISVPLLVSIPGTGESKWDAIYRFAERANTRGWLLLAPAIRSAYQTEGGRTASRAVQHDIIDAIDYLLNDPAFNVDRSRIYLSGFSTGGGIAATVAAKYPHRFAAVVDWAGPANLKDWVLQTPAIHNSLISDIGCNFIGPGMCPFEWSRRSALHVVKNLKHVPMAVVHGRADDKVPPEQSWDFYEYMRSFFVPEDHNKLAVWHDGGHADWLPTFEGLDWLAGFTLNDRPGDIMIRADESKDYYWVHILQKDWNGNWADGYSDVEASYDWATGVISATVWDERPFKNGNLPLDVTFDLRAMGLDPYASYSIEDSNVATGDYVLQHGVVPEDGYLKVELDRDVADRVHHQYLIYPFEPRELTTLVLQQGAGYDGAQDTYIYRDEAIDANHANDGDLVVRYGRSSVGLLKFDISGIPPEAVVKKAQLTLYLNAVSGPAPGNIDISLYSLLPRWVDSEATWELAAQDQAWATAGAQGAGEDYNPTPIDQGYAYQSTFCTFNLKPIMRDWIAEGGANEGVLIAGPEGGSGAVRYRFDSSEAADVSRRPRLEVVYMLATPTPTPTSTSTPTATPSATLNSTPTPTSTSTTGPTSTPTPSLTATASGLTWRVHLPLIWK